MRHLIIIFPLTILSLVAAAVSITGLIFSGIGSLIAKLLRPLMGLIRELNVWAQDKNPNTQANKASGQS